MVRRLKNQISPLEAVPHHLPLKHTPQALLSSCLSEANRRSAMKGMHLKVAPPLNLSISKEVKAREDIEAIHPFEFAGRHDLPYQIEVDVRNWQTEKGLSPWLPDFSANPAISSFRLNAIRRLFDLGLEIRLQLATVHLAIHQLDRLLVALITKECVLEPTKLLTVMCAAFRLAVKLHEAAEAVMNTFPLNHSALYESLNIFGSSVDQSKFIELLNGTEMECALLLRERANIPVGPDWLFRFASIGGWPPDLSREYCRLAEFLLSLSLLSNGPDCSLCGTPPSKLASAALCLSVKIINAEQPPNRRYTEYPQKLAAYTGIPAAALKPTMRGLSRLLIDKPKHSEALGPWFREWGSHSWGTRE